MAQEQARNIANEAGVDLALLALRAAIQLDRLLKEQETDESAVNRLIAELRGSPPDPLDGTAKSLSADPHRLNLLGRAVGDANQQPMKISEAWDHLSNLFDGLTAQSPEQQRASRQQMKTFCLLFHDKLVAEQYLRRNSEAIIGGGLS